MLPKSYELGANKTVVSIFKENSVILNFCIFTETTVKD